MEYLPPNTNNLVSLIYNNQEIVNINTNNLVSLRYDNALSTIIQESITDYFNKNDSLLNNILYINNINDDLSINDNFDYFYALIEFIVDNYSFSDLFNNNNISYAGMIDNFGVHLSSQNEYNTYLMIQESILENLNLSSDMFPDGLALERIVDSLITNDNFNAIMRTKEEIQESIGFSDNLDYTSKIVLLIQDNLNIVENLNGKLYLNASILEDLTLEDGLFFNLIKDNEIVYDYDTWFMNYETKSFTKFTNFYFNSYLKMDGNYYIANEKGLFLVDGNKDDLKDISAVIKTGLLRFGDGIKARVDQAFLYCSNDGNLSIKLKGSDGLEYTYSTSNLSVDKVSKRVKFGKGRTLTYIQFELVNNGSNFELDDIKFTKQIISRIT